MDCCSVNGLPEMFGRSTARQEARAFRKKGPSKRLRGLIDYLAAEGLAGATVLDIGFGVGSFHLELLRRGAKHAVGVEVVEAYLQAATELAGELGLRDAVEYKLGDFTRLAPEVGPADIVVLDRSLCCYPDMPALVRPSAERARRHYALILPIEAWWSRAGFGLFNAFLFVARRRFRSFIHPQAQIDALIAQLGLEKIITGQSGIWRTHLYSRAAVA